MSADLAGSLWIVLVAALSCGSVALLVTAALTSSGQAMARARRFMPGPVAPAEEPADGCVLRSGPGTSSDSIRERILHSNPFARQAARELARARVTLRVGEYFAIMLDCGVFAAYGAVLLTGSPLLAGAAAVAGLCAPRIYVRQREAQRFKAMDAQLVDMLGLCANSLRAGWSFLQALEHVAAELPAPLSEEIRLVLEEVSLGATPEDALIALQKRVPSYDLELIVTAVLIQRRVGGNLAQMMDAISETIRERVKLMGEIRIILSEARLSTWVLALMPFALFGIMAALNGAYVNSLLVDPRGQGILMAAGTLELLGVLILRRMSSIRV